MTKLLIWLLDTAILFAALWFFLLKDLPGEIWYLAGLGLAVLVVWVVAAALKTRTVIKSDTQKDAGTTLEQVQLATQELARQERLIAEREARRPICAHCGKKTEGIFRHRRIDGSLDRRYRDNPLLCNRCFKPYEPRRPDS